MLPINPVPAFKAVREYEDGLWSLFSRYQRGLRYSTTKITTAPPLSPGILCFASANNCRVFLRERDLIDAQTHLYRVTVFGEPWLVTALFNHISDITHARLPRKRWRKGDIWKDYRYMRAPVGTIGCSAIQLVEELPIGSE